MVLVPAGPFLYGDARKQVTFDHSYFIDIYPVTNEQYKKFIEAGGYTNREHWSEEGWRWREAEKVTQPASWDDPEWTKPDHPVVGVSWYEAEAYAKWSGNKRLPTEQEWEKAARGTDGLVYPWGDEFDKEKCNSWESGIGGATPVTKYVNGLSPYGCYDMAGNVLEWTSSDYGSNIKVLRGGSWISFAGSVRSASRDYYLPTSRTTDIGFRCAKTP
jgi:formylglycine-generating enzyme required for sulfatase activity